MKLKIFIGIIIGLIGGFYLGNLLSSFIGIAGMLIFKEPMGIKYLSIYTSLLCAIVVPIIIRKTIK